MFHLQLFSLSGTLWRQVSAVDSQSTEVRSSARSNLTDKVTDDGPTYVHAETKLQEVPIERSREMSLTSNNKNTVKVDQCCTIIA